MKILQIIDSLEAGGAERIAINTANALMENGMESHLCSTRKEGILKESLNDAVGYIFLDRKGPVGILGLLRLYRYIKACQITHVHAHSTSFLTAALMKCFKRSLTLIWHDHYGHRIYQTRKENRILVLCSSIFDAVITVNEAMKFWAVKYLKSTQVTVLPNFVRIQKSTKQVELSGKKGKRMVCLANLRPDKDHLNLISAFKKIVASDKAWTLLLVGKDFQDEYSRDIRKVIVESGLQESIEILGSQADIKGICSQADIGILSSKSEGLPVALLEYGLYQLPVIVTDVGACAEVVQSYGIVVPPQDAFSLSQAMRELIRDESKRNNLATNFHKHIVENYGSEQYVERLLELYRS